MPAMAVGQAMINDYPTVPRVTITLAPSITVLADLSPTGHAIIDPLIIVGTGAFTADATPGPARSTANTVEGTSRLGSKAE